MDNNETWTDKNETGTAKNETGTHKNETLMEQRKLNGHETCR